MADYLLFNDDVSYLLLESGGGDRLLLNLQGVTITGQFDELIGLGEEMAAQIIARPDTLETLRLADEMAARAVKLKSTTSAFALNSFFIASFAGLSARTIDELLGVGDEVSALAKQLADVTNVLRLDSAFSSGQLLQTAIAQILGLGDAGSATQRAVPVRTATLGLGALWDAMVGVEFTQIMERLRVSDSYTARAIHRATVSAGLALSDSVFAGDIVIALFGRVQLRTALSGELIVKS